MQVGSLTVLPHENGEVTIGIADDDRDVLVAGERMSAAEARSTAMRIMEAARIAGGSDGVPTRATAGSIL